MAFFAPKVGVRPVTVTSTTGVPVATIASSSASWPPGRSSESRSPLQRNTLSSSFASQEAFVPSLSWQMTGLQRLENRTQKRNGFLLHTPL